MSVKSVASALGLALLLGPAGLAQRSSSGRPSAVDLAGALQAKYDRVRDFSADFVHTYEGGVLRKKVSERGTVLVKKPGKMRWTYTAPEEKVFVSDGVKIYSYLPADRQVIVNSMPAADQATMPVLFLAGKGSLVRDFRIEYAEATDLGSDRTALRLVPKRPEREYESIVLTVDRGSLQIRGLGTTDRQGGTSTFVFTNLKENVGLADKQFAFEIPRGVDVISGGRASETFVP